jgi:hypothetical protein
MPARAGTSGGSMTRADPQSSSLARSATAGCCTRPPRALPVHQGQRHTVTPGPMDPSTRRGSAEGADSVSSSDSTEPRPLDAEHLHTAVDDHSPLACSEPSGMLSSCFLMSTWIGSPGRRRS